MKIFKLEAIDRMDQNWRISEYCSLWAIVVRALSEKEAREIAQSKGDSESAREKVWLDPSLTSCAELTGEGDPGVILEERTDG